MPVLCLVILFAAGCAISGGNANLNETSAKSARDIYKGNAAYLKGCCNSAIFYYMAAHEISAAAADNAGQALALNNLGNAYRALGKTDTAAAFFNESERLYSLAGDMSGAARALCNLASMLADLGRFEDAKKSLDKARDIISREKRPFFPLVLNRGLLYLDTGKLKQAEDTLEKALKIAGNDGSKLASAHFRLAQVKQKKDEYKAALAHYRAALESDRKTGARRAMADDLAGMGNVYTQLKMPGPAADAFRQALEIQALSGNRSEVTAILPRFSAAAKKAGIDTGVTRFFVNQWLDGKISGQPCD